MLDNSHRAVLLSWGGGGGRHPPHKKVPQDWGTRGLIEKSSNDDEPAPIYLNEIAA